jgi:hypothetical protein
VEVDAAKYMVVDAKSPTTLFILNAREAQYPTEIGEFVAAAKGIPEITCVEPVPITLICIVPRI